eukprot:1524997-Rhodomonas_salina.1
MPPPVYEMVSMALSAMPVLPMPMVVGKEVPDEITTMSGEHVVANSHDLWAMLLLAAMERGGKEDAKKRVVLQQQCVKELFETVRAIQEEAGGLGVADEQARVYAAFGDFTRKNIAALSSSQDVRFAPLDSVQREDRVHIATCHHAAAQDIVFGGLQTDASGGKRTAEEFSASDYAGLIMLQFARVKEGIHVEEGGQ